MNKRGIILVVIGCLFLASNLGWMPWNWLRQWWPLLLIAVGIWSIVDPNPAGLRCTPPKDKQL